MENLIYDIRYSLRLFVKSPGFVAVAVLSLALGISANVTVYSWMQTMLFHPLSGVENGEQVVTLETVTPSGDYIDSSYSDYKDYRDQATSLSGVLAFKERSFVIGDTQQVEWIWGEMVSGNFFDVLGVKPLMGRFFSPEEQEEKPGAYPVAVISSNLWRHRFNSDPAIIGKTIKLNLNELTIVGVAPEEFKGTIVGLYYDVWVPLMMQSQLTGSDWLNDRGSRPLHVMARLAPGVKIDQARAEINTISHQLGEAYPKSNEGITATLLPIWKAPYGVQSIMAMMLVILMGVGGVVLLIVCANVASLLLARATARQKEISIRLALGASRRRIIGQLLTESVLLSLIGGIVGTLLTFWLKDTLRLFIPFTDLPIALSPSLDIRVLGFTLIISLATGLIFGLVPAIQATKLDLNKMLKDNGRGSTGSGSRRLRKLLIVSEVALATIALVGAGLFVTSFQNAKKFNPGFSADNVLLVGLNLSSNGYDRDKGKVFYRQLLERVEALPGVEAVSFAEDVPLGLGGGSWAEVQVDGYVPQRGQNMRIYRNVIAPGYFDVLRIPLLEGRDFTTQDDDKAGRVMIINEAFARRFFQGENPVGREVKYWGRPVTVIGMVKDIKYRNVSEKPLPYIYVPFQQVYRRDTSIAFHIKTLNAPENMLTSVRREIQSIDPNVPIFTALPMAEYITGSFFSQKVAAILLAIYGTVALLLAIFGLYSVMAYSVTQRTREFGIMRALGAQQIDVVRLVVKEGMVVVLIGLVVGLLSSIALARVISSMLFGISGTDPIVLVGISILLIAVALLANLIPARKATKVDPMIALRYE